MNEKLTELVVVLDKSGSMSTVVNDAIGGFNTFLKAQQEAPGDARLTVVQFDTSIQMYVENADIKAVKELSKDTYVPNGNTALYDAVGIQIKKTGERLAAIKEVDRPSKVIFAILTDGEENSSRTYRGGQVAEMIKHQRDKYNWEFVFLAAGEGAFKEAQSLGMDLSKIVAFANTGENQKKSYDLFSSYTANLRSVSSADAAMYKSSVNLQASFDQDEVNLPAPDATTSNKKATKKA